MRERYVEIERKTTAKRIILYFFQHSFMPKKIKQNKGKKLQELNKFTKIFAASNVIKAKSHRESAQTSNESENTRISKTIRGCNK